jgi:hypothetical protein
MIDPVTAFATAQAAVKGVQAAIKLGKDIGAISGDLMKFFDAKDVVAKAAATAPKKGFAQSDTATAFNTVLHLKQLNDAETQLKEMLIWSGNAPLWQALIQERNNIVATRKADEVKAQKAKDKRRKEIDDALLFILSIILGLSIMSFVVWGTMEITGV